MPKYRVSGEVAYKETKYERFETIVESQSASAAPYDALDEFDSEYESPQWSYAHWSYAPRIEEIIEPGD